MKTSIVRNGRQSAPLARRATTFPFWRVTSYPEEVADGILTIENRTDKVARLLELEQERGSEAAWKCRP